MLLVLQIAQYEAVALEVKKLLLVLFWTVFRIMHSGKVFERGNQIKYETFVYCDGHL